MVSTIVSLLLIKSSKSMWCVGLAMTLMSFPQPSYQTQVLKCRGNIINNDALMYDILNAP